MVMIELPEVLDVHTAQQLYDTLNSHIDSDITLDAKNLTSFGTAGQQLIIVARHTWTQKGRKICLENFGPEAKADAETTDLAKFIFTRKDP